MQDEITILFKNPDFIAVDKPAGLSVHNNEDPKNLVTLMEKQLRVKKVYPAHRLDKETSGVQLLALTENMASLMAKEFEAGNVKKMYVGVLRGSLKSNEGTWILPISDKAEGRQNPAGLAKDRVAAETRFRALRNSSYFTLVEFDLKTGRQHQIRKHAALANHALVGDGRYGDKTYNQKMGNLYGTYRMFLHCCEMEVFGRKIRSSVPAEFFSLFGEVSVRDDYQEGQSVELEIISETDMGFKAKINDKDEGVVYHSEVFQPLRKGQKVPGFIKKIRPDGKLDLTIYRTGHQGGDEIGPKILELLKAKNGFLPISDKTAPEEIYRLFGASKKKFKIALGGLYKRRLITIHEDGIRLK